jgi:putative glycosyltransferase (TIGR04372 family)
MAKINNKIKTLIIIVIKKLLFGLNTLWALPFATTCYLLKSKFNIKICKILSSRIGHFAHDTVEHKIKIKNKENKEIILYCVDDQISNKFWLKMAKRELKIKKYLIYVWKWCKIIPKLNCLILETSEWGSADPYGYFYKYLEAKDFAFTNEENRVGREFLAKHGVKRDSKFITLLIRDESFLVNDKLTGRADKKSKEFWSYHSYRNSDVLKYEKAIQWLIDNHYTVLRMGKISKTKLNIQSDKVIDYSFNEEKSDFLDVWLFANCNYCITTGSGIDVIADIYKKPILFINILPITGFTYYNKSKWVPKKLISKQNGIELNMEEYIKSDYHRTEMYEANNIEVIDLNEQEIEIEIKKFIEEEENNKLKIIEIEKSKQFIRKLLESKNMNNEEIYLHPECRASSIWINRIK